LTGTEAGCGESVIVVGPEDVAPPCPPQAVRLSAIARTTIAFKTMPQFNSVAFMFILTFRLHKPSVGIPFFDPESLQVYLS
jgi:hypothetical protein